MLFLLLVLRLNKCLPGLSRRHADAAIFEGRVKVDGKVVTAPGTMVATAAEIRLDGKVQVPVVEFRYLKYWKPKDVVSDEIDLVGERMFTVGRLDKASTGLILVTNDGRVPGLIRGLRKAYGVTVDPRPTKDDVKALAAGLEITVGPPPGLKGETKRIVTQPCEVRIVGENVLEFGLVEGKNRQIRRMCEARGLRVKKLHRLRVGPFTLRGLRPGAFSYFDKADNDHLKRLLLQKQQQQQP
ncbi:hypothetical protein CTAYLR_007738 [Chrysophaeum taylorii]|uniref:RNA-binding S4 domain-containing protein n=1 Tax=Chrysophaeum taylorii TaxID=2483200 RepID=A0AAD7UN62_9STRA|nr:hypothetical protein CTAYLR_007738 [Chrysophaeum taylorii]